MFCQDHGAVGEINKLFPFPIAGTFPLLYCWVLLSEYDPHFQAQNSLGGYSVWVKLWSLGSVKSIKMAPYYPRPLGVFTGWFSDCFNDIEYISMSVVYMKNKQVPILLFTINISFISLLGYDNLASGVFPLSITT
ncbi:hypothetical protein AVEN_262074-1 [Araneus ventricosus]|uniref:Uncharacterized protein n=1 Tax=Araneus ventricosus TaxID=182803 RepID=A0A4Y2WGK7_ARAVE|nr:hypothetical protein AVEN_262074-1 [Araneus ventricosus]